MIDSKKIISYIKKHINPYGKPFEGTLFEFGCKVIDYIEAMDKQPKTDWIPCEERLPIGEEYRKKFDDEWYYKKVLSTTSEGNMYVGFYYQEDECWYDNAGFVFFPIAWQPLPQPYKKEGAE